MLNRLDLHDALINHSALIIFFTINTHKQPAETMIEAFTRLDGEILEVENLSPGSRLTTAEAWVEHLEVNVINILRGNKILSRDFTSCF